MQNVRLPFPRCWRLADALRHFRNRHFLALDLFILSLTPLMALLLRIDQLASVAAYQTVLILYTVSALAIRLFIFYRSGLYARYWRFASLDELLLVGAAVCLSSTLLFGLFSILLPLHLVDVEPLQLLPRSIPLIDGLLALLFVGGNRLSVRLTERWRRGSPDGAATRVAIVGAGDTGSTSLREIKTHPQLGLKVVGFVDDDPVKAGMTIHGAPVLGGCDQIPELVSQHAIDQIFIAMPSAPGKEVRRILHMCEQVGVQAKMIPALHELFEGHFSIDLVRNIELEDLLRRAPVRIDTQAVSELLRGRRVLVTGGGGSIGGELCRQILACGPERLTIVGHGENSVFEIHKELQTLKGAKQTEIQTVIADVRFAGRILRVFQQEQPHVVFHAAAHKHVHLMEQHPTEAVINNILGTKNVLQAAQAVQVERFVMISTDKAVNPTSVMGATKRVAELLVHQAAQATGKPYCAVRFGNVLGSRGSVVLTFKQQIAAGGPVTVTHPEMVRFFMTIPEAVQLVLQAAVLGHGGEVFMLDMGQPVRILDLARDLIQLSGLQEGRDIDIVFSGLRPGEKLYEEMFTPDESYKETVHEKLLIAANAARFVPGNLDQALEALAYAARLDDCDAAIRLLENLLPEYGRRWSFNVDHQSSHRPPSHADPRSTCPPTQQIRASPLKRLAREQWGSEAGAVCGIVRQ
ncbi:MAG: nucleoside-diphosphate sugar epimerase/dehydratase [Caldilineaceae bacterium]